LFQEEIVKLSGEIDFAVQWHKEEMRKEEERKSKILNRKLKPKGKVSYEFK